MITLDSPLCSDTNCRIPYNTSLHIIQHESKKKRGEEMKVLERETRERVEREYRKGNEKDILKSTPAYLFQRGKVTSNSVPTPHESKVVKNVNVIAPGMFRINPSKTTREDKFVPINKVKASVRTNMITVSQPHVITKKEVNSDSNGLFSTGVDNTAKTRRPQPRSNTKNDRVPS
ncbi:hypothetical protein Tco_1579295, partial [Tanacetum coccineum]